ncbi:MAG: class I SAM-dependent methyltransferase [Gammaproteobacteria bacterium]|nr:class I SAM-dependent methyltransferase [Gammaproteobacteria bacterium]
MEHDSIEKENKTYNPCRDEKNVAVQNALLEIGHYLKGIHYQFTTITPESHRIVLARKSNHNEKGSNSTDQILKDFFGWNLPVLKENIPLSLLSLISKAKVAIEMGLYLQSKIRFSTVDDNLFLHSSYPTSESDAVFFGPDTYRFIRFLKNKINAAKIIVDLGCGPGTGGIVLTNLLNQNIQNQVKKLYLGDINPTALNYALINTALNQLDHVEVILSHLLDDIPKGADLIVANPPFIIDPNQRSYRHGGAQYGSQLSVHMVQSALTYLEPGGVLALYTGTCIVQGKDIFFQQIKSLLDKDVTHYEYEEIDCDIFGEELTQPDYRNVERIAAVGLLAKKK